MAGDMSSMRKPPGKKSGGGEGAGGKGAILGRDAKP